MKISLPLALNEIGGRTNNEDNIFPQKGNATETQRFFVVCDGMGGHENGEVASSAVCESFAATLQSINPENFDKNIFEDALSSAYDALDKKDASTSLSAGASAGSKKMGTTLAFLHLNNRRALMAHIGDSRVYHIRKDKNGKTTILYKSSDHSFVNELVQSGIITEEEAAKHPKRNVITRVMQPNLEKRYSADIHITRNVAAGDRFFLCTDGVLESFSDAHLCHIISENTDDETIIKAIDKLCQNHSRDNFSAYLVSVIEDVEEEVITVIEEEEIIFKHEAIKTEAESLKPKKSYRYMLMILLAFLLLGFGAALLCWKHKPTEQQKEQIEKQNALFYPDHFEE